MSRHIGKEEIGYSGHKHYEGFKIKTNTLHQDWEWFELGDTLP